MTEPTHSPDRRFAGMTFERRLLLDALIVLSPTVFVVAVLLWQRDAIGSPLILLISLAAVVTVLLLVRMQHRVVFPLYTLSNLLEALREGDFSLRGTRARRGDAIGDVIWEINALSQTLRDQRLRVEETSALLGKVLSAIDIALYSFDGDQRLRLINPAGERLVGTRSGRALGQTADALGLADCLAVEGAAVIRRSFPGGSGSFDVRRFAFRQDGRPHDLLVITDLSRALREEERQAWQRLIRVLGHELNNSLAPIKSMAGTLSQLLGREPLDADWREDTQGGLKVIADRAEALNRFMIGYASLARLPAPSKCEVALRPLLGRVVALEQRLQVELDVDDEIVLQADPDQLEQALINLVKNAVEAALPQHGGVCLRTSRRDGRVLVEVLDEGLGVSGTDNLFVPFFTTKPGGSGIGLVLERHLDRQCVRPPLDLEGGERRGCVARIELPID